EMLEMARMEIAARKVEAAERRTTRDFPWRYGFFGLLGGVLLGLLAWPGLPLDRKMYSVVHGVCAQIHNVQIGGVDLPLCARNTGIYSSFLITSLYLLALGRQRAAKLPRWPITIALILFVALMAVVGV